MIESDYTLFPARTVCVHAPNLIEATLDLGFGVSLTRIFRLDTVSTDGLDEEAYSRAKHCLVVLLGGKRLLVQPQDERTFKNPIEARIYLDEKTHGKLVGQTCGMSTSVDPVLEVGPYVNWLRARGFDLDDVKFALNGYGGQRAVRR